MTIEKHPSNHANMCNSESTTVDFSNVSVPPLPHHLPEKNHPVLLIEIDPKRCKPWHYHNRDKANLTKEHCAKLIKSIQHDGQLDPILVRKLIGDPEADYEIIYGVRRTFACSQIPEQGVVAQITDASDKTCMILMHSENANSKNISEFERAYSFAQQMKSGHFKNQAEIAEMMSVSQGSISKMIKAVEILEVEWVAALFQNKINIPIKPAYTLSLLLRKVEARERIKIEANLIQKSIREIEVLPPSKILHRLIAGAKGKTNTTFESVILMVNNQPVVCYRQNKSGKFTIIVEEGAGKLTPLEIETACILAIRERVLNKLFPGNKVWGGETENLKAENATADSFI